MNASKTMPLFSMLFSVSNDIQCCKMLGIRLINTTFRRFNTAVERSIFKSIQHNSFSNVYRFYGTITVAKSNIRLLSSARLKGTSDHTEDPITKPMATDLVLRLTEEERKYLLSSLQEFEANKVKAEYEGQLAAARWRSRFGRPSKLPTLGDVDPTGTYCQLSDDWLKKKYAKIRYNPIIKKRPWEFETENVPPPTMNQLVSVGIYNAIPFVGFGFLDNFIMIIAQPHDVRGLGDYIEITLGTFITISTMAAAALGNTISDVMGIGSAWYVEMLATKVGLKAPNLSPVQLDMKSARRFANLGRAMGIIVGCLLGMFPLLFMNTAKAEDKSTKEKPLEQ